MLYEYKNGIKVKINDNRRQKIIVLYCLKIFVKLLKFFFILCLKKNKLYVIEVFNFR